MTDYTVIDVDGHVFEPDELWERYLPARFHDGRPKLVRDDRGTTRYLLEGRMIPQGTGRGAWVPEGMRESSVHREGAVDPKLRLEDMDLEGIDMAVLYGVVSLGFYRMEDRDLCIACCRAYNDWLHDYCQAEPDRLKGTPALPLACEFPFNGMFAATTLVCGGVFERFASLRIALLESGAGWVPFLFERLDEHYEKRAEEMPNISRPPSEYLAEGRLFVSTEGEDGLPEIISQAGADWLVWASDYPHWDTDFPNSVTNVEGRDDLTSGDKRQLFESNPRRLLGRT
jgi:predicted TIM-barrel fold metal-dependent hydrolase